MSKANVDEVFIDLCRQIIRRDNVTTTSALDDEYDYMYGNDATPAQGQTRRDRRRHRHRRQRKKAGCTIL